MSSIAVVGAGVVGMRIAHRLRQAGHEVTLYDAAPGAGGLVASQSLDLDDGRRVEWDRYYHVVLAGDTRTRALLSELGLGAALRFAPTRTGYWAEGRLHVLGGVTDMVRLPGVGLFGTARIGATIVAGALARNGSHLDRVRARDWLVRRSGRRAYERFWAPQLEAKLGNAASETAASFIVASIARLAGARRVDRGAERLGWIRGGYRRVIDAWVGALDAAGVTVRFGTPVERVGLAADGRGVQVHSGGTALRHDHVVVTAAAPAAAAMIDGLPGAEQARLAAVRSFGVIAVSLVLRRPLGGCYLTYLAEALPFTAVVEMTALIDPAEVGGNTLVYLPRYLPCDDPRLERPDAEITREFTDALARMYPQVAEAGEVLGTGVARARHVFAAPLVGHEPLAGFAAGVPGVWLCTSAHLAHATLNVHDSLGLADAFLEAFSDALLDGSTARLRSAAPMVP